MKVGDLVELSARGSNLEEYRKHKWPRRKTGQKRMLGIVIEVKHDSYYGTGYRVKWFDGTWMQRPAYARGHLKLAR